MQRLLLQLLLAGCLATAPAAAANVCALPAAALFLPATNASAPLARCWSDNAGVTVSAKCVAACACRRLEVAAGQQRAACLATSPDFRCVAGGGADCSAYALNVDGSSTLRSGSSAQTPQASAATVPPTTVPTTTVPPVDAAAKSEGKNEGLATWAWALIALALAFGVAIVVLGLCWRRCRRRYVKHADDTLEYTESVHAWKDAEALEADLQAIASLPMATATSAANTVEPALNLAVVAGTSNASYHTYRLGPTAELDHESYQHQQRQQQVPVTRSDDKDASSIDVRSPVYQQQRDSYSSRQSPATSRERLTNGSRISYTSAISYGSEMDSFTSQLTFVDSEPRDTESVCSAHYHDHEQQQRQQRFFGADIPPYPRKKSTEF